MSGEYLPTPSGGLRLDIPATCRNGHSPVRPGHGQCPRCRKYLMRFRCLESHCDGDRASDSHDNVECAVLAEQYRQRWAKD